MSIKALKVAKAALKTPGVFAGGVAFGTFGLKLLSTKDLYEKEKRESNLQELEAK